MNFISKRQSAYLLFNFIIGGIIGSLFTDNAKMVVIGLVIVNIVASVLLVIMEAKYRYWLYIGMPTLGFVVGYFGFLGNK